MEEINHQWIQKLEHHCCELICTGDALLSKYPVPGRRRRSIAAGYFYRVLRQLCRFSIFLSGETKLQIKHTEAALEERMRLLQHRWILSYSALRKLRKHCLALEQLPEPSIPVKWGTSDVLVGSLRRPSQLDICLEHGFYHVPMQQISPERLPIRYVAIYQSRKLFPHDCGIRYYGAVKHCTLLPRCKISQIPKASNEPYYRMEIESWQQLDPPIAVREVPFTHLFTNTFLLHHSRETLELGLRSPEEYQYFHALRLTAMWGRGTAFKHPNGEVRLCGKNLQIHRSGRRAISLSLQQYHQTPAAFFRKVINILEDVE